MLGLYIVALVLCVGNVVLDAVARRLATQVKELENKLKSMEERNDDRQDQSQA